MSFWTPVKVFIIWERRVNNVALSPMMQHYVATKEEYKDCILFYRLGDFYEMFLRMLRLYQKNWN